MLPCPHHTHCPHLSITASLRCQTPHNPNPTALILLSTAAKRLHSLTVYCSTAHHQQQPVENPEANSPNDKLEILRKHNARSTALLLRYLSHHQELNPEAQPGLEHDHAIPEEDKVKLLQLSLVTKRTPQFPGSIYVQSPSDADVNTSLPPLQRLLDGRGDHDDKMLFKAIDIRRNVTVEIFKKAMRKGKFGITYSTNLVSRLTDFFDYVMIEAASMKRLPEFSQSTFNVRAKTFIDNSDVVPLIRWLKHNSLSYPQIAKLICMARGNLHSIRLIAEWLKSIHVKGRFIGVALTRAGGNILERSVEEFEEIVGYLESNGVRREWMGYVMCRCPEFLSYSMEEVKSRVQFYLDMGMDDKDFGTMVFDYPKVLGYFSFEEMNQKVSNSSGGI